LILQIPFRVKKYMDVLAQAQTLVVEHAFTIGIGLLVAALIAGAIWFWMSRNGSKSSVLENQARVNEATTATPTPEMPSQEQLEEMARYREQMDAQMMSQQQSQGDNQMPSSNE
jgi:hypothetical protein